MDSTVFAMTASMMAKDHLLTVTTNNLANAQTVGFKRDEGFVETLEGLVTQHRVGDAEPLVVLPSWVPPTTTVWHQGITRQTGGPLDLALDGHGFFLLEAPEGPRVTRDGRFLIDAEEKLVDDNGHAVLDVEEKPITINVPGPLTVSMDGVIKAGGIQVAQLKLVAPDYAELEKVGTNDFVPKEGVELPDATDAEIRQGFVELSNTQPTYELLRLVQLQRTYDAQRRILSSLFDEFQHRTVDDLIAR